MSRLVNGAVHIAIPRREHRDCLPVNGRFHSIRPFIGVTLLSLLAACSSSPPQTPPPPADRVRSEIVRLLPANVSDRQGWAADIYTAFDTQKITPSVENLCSVLAVTEQESNFQVDPAVPGMGKIAQDEIDRRASKAHIPNLLVRSALDIRSPTGKTYNERLAAARTEKDLSGIFDDFIGMVPLGKTLFGSFNPVHTAGPMQVSIEFAERQARDYPYPVDASIRHEVFTRRGGMYFGIVHLLGYPVSYDKPLYRFADFNAGWYASRNAAFQSAVARLSGKRLALDGDLISYSFGPSLGQTELAVRSLHGQLGMRNTTIRSALEKGETAEFESTDLYKQVFALADKAAGKPLPRAILPGIVLESPKITRKLTTAWFAQRVEERRVRCMSRASGKLK
ncbi:DUF1615 domain-containing protein [Pseudomonas sp. Pseu.R1]|uniref:DUF1615 domain-containing protein n=1 Tax=Pseudomonas sp. Pseu.R1 TaxID=3379818 RepID=UPI003B939742